MPPTASLTASPDDPPATVPASGPAWADATPPVECLFLLLPNRVTLLRVADELAGGGVPYDQVGSASAPALRVRIGERDWRTLLEGLAAALSDAEQRDLRVAVLPAGTDDRSRRRALATARPLASILEEFSDAWLYRLLQRNGLAVHFQPIVEYPPGRIHGYECLVRGQGGAGTGAGDVAGNLIPPARLFAAAGRLGVRYLLDQQACRTAVSAAASLGFANVRFVINAMAGAIENPAASAAWAASAVRAGGLSPENVTFELVDAESLLPRGLDHLARVSAALRSAGFAVSLDDVGAGGASLLPLDDLRPAYVKFDADLCRRAAAGAYEAALFRALCQSALRHGALPIAKGLETEDQLRFAIDAGVPLTQGFVHSGPAPTPLDAKGEDQVLRAVRRTAILAM